MSKLKDLHTSKSSHDDCVDGGCLNCFVACTSLTFNYWAIIARNRTAVGVPWVCISLPIAFWKLNCQNVTLPCFVWAPRDQCVQRMIELKS